MSYQKKYLKYKSKYLRLKNIIGGAGEGDVPGPADLAEIQRKKELNVAHIILTSLNNQFSNQKNLISNQIENIKKLEIKIKEKLLKDEDIGEAIRVELKIANDTLKNHLTTFGLLQGIIKDQLIKLIKLGGQYQVEFDREGDNNMDPLVAAALKVIKDEDLNRAAAAQPFPVFADEVAHVAAEAAHVAALQEAMRRAIVDWDAPEAVQRRADAQAERAARVAAERRAGDAMVE